MILKTIQVDMSRVLAFDSYMYALIRASQDEDGIYHIPARWHNILLEKGIIEGERIDETQSPL